MSSSSLGDGVTVFDFIELLHASNWVSSPVYAGWLQKRSKNWIMSFSGFAWQPKWVALHGLELIYMDDEPTNDNKSSIHIKRMTIGSTTKIMDFDEEERNDPLCFSIQSDCTKPQIWQFRAESEEEKTNWLIKISQVHAIAAWLDSYTKERVLGVGAQGTVYEMVHKTTGQRFAVKEVNIENEKQMKMAITEAKLLMEVTKNVSHPCIMQIEKVFQVVDKFFLVFPLCTGGELYEAVVRRGHFTERKASRIMHDLVSALHALHQFNILHLDIKPENILFESDLPNARIKLTDFGLSKVFLETPESLHTRPTQVELAARAESFINCGNFNADHVRGTFGYMSPELILSGYCSTASDVFAAGVILYILLCGYPPFNSKSVRQLFVRTVKGAYKLSGPEWDGISVEAKDLVKRMLDVNMETRITTAEVLAHPWIVKVAEADALYQHQQQKESLSRSHAASLDETLLQTSAAVHVSDGLIGKSSVVYGSLLAVSGIDSVHSTTSTSTKSTHPTTVYNPEYFDTPIANTDVSLKIALNHLAGHVKVLKTEKLAKTMTRLMLAKQKSGDSKLATIYLKPYRSSGVDGGSSSKVSDGSSKVSGGISSGGSGNSSSGTIHNSISMKSSAMAPIQEEGTFDSTDDYSTTNTHNTNTHNNNINTLHMHNLSLYDTDTTEADTDLISSTNTSGKDSFQSFQFDSLDLEKLDIHSPISPVLNTTHVVNVSSVDSVKSPITPSGNKDDELLQMVNSEAREIVTSALFDYFGAREGCLSMEQFVRLLVKMGLVGKCFSSGIDCNSASSRDNIGTTSTGTDSNDSSANTKDHTTTSSTTTIPLDVSLYGALIAQFTDAAGKGHVTLDDFYTAQVLILQRSELYLRTIYKQYQHSLAYPGRHINFNSAYNSLQHTNGSVLTLEVEPPRYITAKHVASVFERFGYDPRSGTKVFTILYDVLAKLKRERRVSSVGGIDGISKVHTHTHNTITNHTETEHPPSHTHTTSSIITEGVMSAFSFFATPIKALHLAHNTDTTHTSHTTNTTNNTHNTTNTTNTNTYDNTNTENTPMHSPSSPTTPPLSPHLTHAIDVNEFLHLSQMDEVLVDVFSREAHMKLFTLFQRVELQYFLCREKMGESVDTEVLKAVVKEEVKVVLDDPTF